MGADEEEQGGAGGDATGRERLVRRECDIKRLKKH